MIFGDMQTLVLSMPWSTLGLAEPDLDLDLDLVDLLAPLHYTRSAVSK